MIIGIHFQHATEVYMLRLGASLSYLTMWGIAALGQATTPAAEDHGVSIKTFFGAITATAVFIYWLSNLKSGTDKKIDELSSKVEANRVSAVHHFELLTEKLNSLHCVKFKESAQSKDCPIDSNK